MICGLTSDFVVESDNKQRLHELAAARQLVDLSSLHKKPWRERFTFTGKWTSEERRQREYDRFLVSHRDRGLFQKLKVIKGTLTHSDHRMVVMEMKLGAIKKPSSRKIPPQIIRSKEKAEQASKRLAVKYTPEVLEQIENGPTSAGAWWTEFE
ncbi:unnamed protein product, partial [Amoebophrya sp. A120]|eukprot:GSA120T00014750001.1